MLPEPVDPAQGLVLQYELKLTNGLSCGGAYLKFVTADGSFTPEGLKDDTPYTVMFGPDKCGATNKVGAAADVPDSPLRRCTACRVHPCRKGDASGKKAAAKQAGLHRGR